MPPDHEQYKADEESYFGDNKLLRSSPLSKISTAAEYGGAKGQTFANLRICMYVALVTHRVIANFEDERLPHFVVWMGLCRTWIAKLRKDEKVVHADGKRTRMLDFLLGTRNFTFQWLVLEMYIVVNSLAFRV